VAVEVAALIGFAPMLHGTSTATQRNAFASLGHFEEGRLPRGVLATSAQRWSRTAGPTVQALGRAGSGGGSGKDTQGSVVPRRAMIEEMAMWTAENLAKLAAFVAAFRAGAYIAVIGQPQVPPQQGEFAAVGSRIIEDLGGVRARVFYPAEGGGREAPYLSDGRATSDAMAGLVKFPGFLLEHLASAPSGILQEPPPAADGKSQGWSLGTRPVLLYSHGQGGNMDMGAYFFRQLAGRGFVVVSVEHGDGSASTGAPGKPLFGENRRSVNYRAMELVSAAEALRAQPSLAPGGDPVGSLFVGGHSYGGPTALIAGATRPNLFRGLVLHDPAIASFVAKPPLPIWAVVGDEYAFIGPLVREVKKVTEAGSPGGAWHYVGASHGNFVDAPLWAPIIIMRLLKLLLIPAAGGADPAVVHADLALQARLFAEKVMGYGDGKGSMPDPPFEPL